MAATGTEEVKVKVPSTDSPLLKGGSFRNLEICSFAPRVRLPLPKSVPSVSVK